MLEHCTVYLYIWYAYIVYLQSHVFGQLGKHWESNISLHMSLFINCIPSFVDPNALEHAKMFLQSPCGFSILRYKRLTCFSQFVQVNVRVCVSR